MNSFSFPVNSLTAFVAPGDQATASRWTSPLQFGEIAFMLWLSVRGAKLPANSPKAENLAASA